MIGIKSISFERNGNILNISIANKSEVLYKDIKKTIDNNLVLKYLELFFRIIDNWKSEYVDTKTIDGEYWNLIITYVDGSKKEYYGKANYPNNFEAFERLNQTLIKDVQNG